MFVFLILGFFTFLYLLAIEPELINKKSKKHQNIIENIKLNLTNQKIKLDANNLENYLYRSNFILDEVDQIRFFNINKEILVDSSAIDINKRSLFITERIETLGINETLNQDQNEIKKKIESSINPSSDPIEVVNWYKENSPITVKGAIDYMEFREKIGILENKKKVIQDIWINKNLTHRQQKNFIKKS